VKLGRHSARFADAARPVRVVGALAEEQTREPERELLLSDAPRPFEQKAGRQRVASDRLPEPLLEGRVTVEGEQWHPAKIRPAYGCEKVLG
jgi:hypothetical protein